MGLLHRKWSSETGLQFNGSDKLPHAGRRVSVHACLTQIKQIGNAFTMLSRTANESSISMNQSAF